MNEKAKCGRCKHKLPKSVCGCKASLNYGKKMAPNDSCDNFLSNPAQEHLSSALAKGVLASSSPTLKAVQEVFQHLQQAIALGLPADDEVIARFALGEKHFELMRLQPGFTAANLSSSQHLKDGIVEMEKAIALDRKGGFGYFSERLNRLRLAELDKVYCYFGALKKESGDLGGAIEYAKTKLSQFDYLPSTPLLDLTCFLGTLLEERGEHENARELYRKMLNSEQRDFTGQDASEHRARQIAAQRLQAIETTSSGDSKCFIATAACGTPTAPEVYLLSLFRDQVLCKNVVGRCFIKIYYIVSPFLARSIENSLVAKFLVRCFLISPTVSLIRITMRKQCDLPGTQHLENI